MVTVDEGLFELRPNCWLLGMILDVWKKKEGQTKHVVLKQFNTDDYGNIVADKHKSPPNIIPTNFIIFVTKSTNKESETSVLSYLVCLILDLSYSSNF